MVAASTIEEGVARLAEDGFVAYPTETVWGLAASAKRPAAVAALMGWKGRAGDAPMSVLVTSAEEAAEFGCRLEPAARRLIDAFWPGPLTLVVPCDRRFAPGVARADGALGLRCSPHPVAHDLAVAARVAGIAPLTSTSCNRSGDEPARDFEAVRAMLHDAQQAVDDSASPGIVFASGQDAGGGAPSSVVDCTGARPEILRQGAIDASALEDAWSGSSGGADAVHA